MITSILFFLGALILFVSFIYSEKIMLLFTQADNATWRLHYTRNLSLIGALICLCAAAYFLLT
ncbi:hypothetical protein [Kurthia senegalensis]|uniref:hypothetical protein n=1 Tax=Kurthia senegalensis TaxID=1033740 RepID=UPI0002E247EC|nr:hypothetical protein [Kurthia senegalensis]